MSMCILVIVVVSADECDCHLNVTDPLGRVIRPTKSFQLIGISNAEVVFYFTFTLPTNIIFSHCPTIKWNVLYTESTKKS